MFEAKDMLNVVSNEDILKLTQLTSQLSEPSKSSKPHHRRGKSNDAGKYKFRQNLQLALQRNPGTITEIGPRRTAEKFLLQRTIIPRSSVHQAQNSQMIPLLQFIPDLLSVHHLYLDQPQKQHCGDETFRTLRIILSKNDGDHGTSNLLDATRGN